MVNTEYELIIEETDENGINGFDKRVIEHHITQGVSAFEIVHPGMKENIKSILITNDIKEQNTPMNIMIDFTNVKSRRDMYYILFRELTETYLQRLNEKNKDDVDFFTRMPFKVSGHEEALKLIERFDIEKLLNGK